MARNTGCVCYTGVFTMYLLTLLMCFYYYFIIFAIFCVPYCFRIHARILLVLLNDQSISLQRRDIGWWIVSAKIHNEIEIQYVRIHFTLLAISLLLAVSFTQWTSIFTNSHRISSEFRKPDSAKLKHRGHNGYSRLSKVIDFCRSRMSICDFLFSLIVTAVLAHTVSELCYS